MEHKWQLIATAPKWCKAHPRLLVCFKGQFDWVIFTAQANGPDTYAPGYAKPTHWAHYPKPPKE